MELINEAVPCESILITFTSMNYEAKNYKKWMNLYKGKIYVRYTDFLKVIAEFSNKYSIHQPTCITKSSTDISLTS